MREGRPAAPRRKTATTGNEGLTRMLPFPFVFALFLFSAHPQPEHVTVTHLNVPDALCDEEEVDHGFAHARRGRTRLSREITRNYELRWGVYNE